MMKDFAALLAPASHDPSCCASMRHRIFVDVIEPRTTVSGDEFHHSVRVVRVKPGEEVELFDKAGHAAKGTIESIDRDQAVIVTGELLASRESLLDLRLALAVIQLEKFELVLQKATELGVTSFTPLVTDRVELRRERYSGKMDRWERIVFEAVKQSGRTRVPAIEEPAAFREVVARPGTKIIFDADREAGELQSVDAATLFIGPEGGWSDEELALATASGCVFQRLGPRRLRAETAAITAAAIIAARFGDL